jgi:hypothetical protein
MTGRHTPKKEDRKTHPKERKQEESANEDLHSHPKERRQGEPANKVLQPHLHVQ